MTADRIRRSLLYTPADDADMMRKAATTQADALAFDLEDAVPADRLPDARENLQAVVPDLETDAEIGVRVNAIESVAWPNDVAAAVKANVDAVLVPKVKSPADASSIVNALRAAIASTKCSEERDMPAVRLAVETPTGLLSLPEIAARGRELQHVIGLSFGLADYCRALGAPEPTEAVRERLAFRVASVAAGNELYAFASAHLDVDDTERLRQIAENARTLGFEGMGAIHPDQLPVINEAFTPDPDRVARSRRLVAAYEDADRDAIRVEGAFLDDATVAWHRAQIERAEAIREAEGDK